MMNTGDRGADEPQRLQQTEIKRLNKKKDIKSRKTDTKHPSDRGGKKMH